MEGGSLFNPGFLGAHFNWWIGQIAEDSTWRDNILPGKFQDAEQIPGWGRRYKVRIIGLHDKEEETIPSDQLPWANVMYPITAGGGQAAASQTANLRQGMFVFGFFLDGQDQQVPVIMGVLGNNAQTKLSTRTGTTQQNYSGTSGYAEPANGNKDTNIKAPDSDLVTTKPKGPTQSSECAPVPKGTKVNKYGLRPDKPLTSQQLSDAQSARAEGEARGLNGIELENFVQERVASGIRSRCEQANSPGSASQPGATKESADAVHQVTVADVKKQDRYLRKIPLGNPHDPIASSLTSIQILLDNLTKDINKVLQTALAYIDAASNVLGQIQDLIDDTSCKIAKYMKPIFDKILEFILKQVHSAIAPTVNLLFPNQRHMYADIKEQITRILVCIFEKIIENLCDQIRGILQDQVDTVTPTPDNRAPKVPICYVENLTGQVISANKEEITNGVDRIIERVDDFLQNIRDQIESILGGVADASGVLPSIDGISGNITEALNFENFSINIFGCDFKPNLPISDFYTFQSGGSASEEPEKPRINDVGEASQKSATAPTAAVTQFATPSRDTPDVEYKNSSASLEATSAGIA